MCAPPDTTPRPQCHHACGNVYQATPILNVINIHSVHFFTHTHSLSLLCFSLYNVYLNGQIQFTVLCAQRPLPALDRACGVRKGVRYCLKLAVCGMFSEKGPTTSPLYVACYREGLVKWCVTRALMRHHFLSRYAGSSSDCRSQ
jgi:hypothetical protein